MDIGLTSDTFRQRTLVQNLSPKYKISHHRDFGGHHLALDNQEDIKLINTFTTTSLTLARQTLDVLTLVILTSPFS
ncbi:hypothetical protein [Cupriavidus sp. UYPR2.512]|uniref:hypothetical protein n=1 Tax=Cupriavidus sp. UYPR2.512 TaxID=1080187 RepID=UPI0012F9E4CD|nr:hypothetical protein [Cupriavidus sp. UYPR2.512]UIF88484.1 hypothetical protein KAF44_24185 [Cupriavidus necator]